MRASCWVQPETRKQSESKARLCRVFGEILSPAGVQKHQRARRITGPSYAHVAEVELERAR